MLGALITAGATVGGALIDANSTAQTNRQQIALADPQNIRDKYEAAGFNPLLGIGNGYQVPQLATPLVGQTIANGMADAGALWNESKQLELQKQALQAENQRLTQKVNTMTIRPNVPGVYGNGNAQNAGATRRPPISNDGSRIGDTHGVNAPDRELKVEPYTSFPGMGELSNSYTDKTGGPVTVLGDPEDPWDVWQIIGQAPVIGAQMAYRAGKAVGQSREERKLRKDMTRAYESQYRSTLLGPSGQINVMDPDYISGWAYGLN